MAHRELALVPGERRADVAVAIAALMGARASHFGRAPVVGDAAVAEAILGFGTEDPSWRTAWTGGLAHDHHALRRLVAATDRAALVSTLEQVHRRVEDGEHLLSAPE